jgi:hypothetical protein
MAMGMAAADGSQPVRPMQSSVVTRIEWDCAAHSARKRSEGIGQTRIAWAWPILCTAFGIAGTPDQVDQLEGLVQK